MSEIGQYEFINNISVDSFFLSNWPENMQGCWLGINYGVCRTEAYLVRNSSYEQGTVVEVLGPQLSTIATLQWDSQYFATILYVEPEYRNNDIGYTLFLWLRAWLAINKSAKLMPPRKKFRVEVIQRMVERFKSIYPDDDIII